MPNILLLLFGSVPCSYSGQTEGYSGADLENLCREAALQALRENISATCVVWHLFYSGIPQFCLLFTLRGYETFSGCKRSSTAVSSCAYYALHSGSAWRTDYLRCVCWFCPSGRRDGETLRVCLTALPPPLTCCDTCHRLFSHPWRVCSCFALFYLWPSASRLALRTNPTRCARSAAPSWTVIPANIFKIYIIGF